MNTVVLQMIRDEAVRIQDAMNNLVEQQEHLTQLLSLLEQPELIQPPAAAVPAADSASDPDDPLCRCGHAWSLHPRLNGKEFCTEKTCGCCNFTPAAPAPQSEKPPEKP